jgi:cellulose synthase/poly-beta-1,6-N-acetylglucosamine synthase-like glycosyltransferase
MRAESDLGILAKASGTALAFRRSSWRPIPESSDADISLPCLIASQGELVLFVPGAIVADDGPGSLRTVFRARRRMANQALANVPSHVVELARNGYWGHAASLTLHKVLRWIAPVTLVICAIDALVLGLLGQWGFAALLTATVLSGLLGLSVVSVIRGNRLSVAAGFVMTQFAFIAGAADCLRGSGVHRWDR